MSIMGLLCDYYDISVCLLCVYCLSSVILLCEVLFGYCVISV